MAGKAFNPVDAGYVEVKDRIVAFYEKYPEGAIRTNIFSMEDNLVAVGAEVFTHRDDENPMGTGFSAMQIPGKTPYTKDSELENAETSAVGRAIAMAGFLVHKSIASAEEVEMRIGDPETVAPKVEDPMTALRLEVRKLAEELYGPGWKGSLLDLGLSVTKKDTKEALLLAQADLTTRRMEREIADASKTTVMVGPTDPSTDDIPF